MKALVKDEVKDAFRKALDREMSANVEGVNGVRGPSSDRVRARFLVSH